MATLSFFSRGRLHKRADYPHRVRMKQIRRTHWMHGGFSQRHPLAAIERLWHPLAGTVFGSWSPLSMSK
jgi:hypothetical protein